MGKYEHPVVAYLRVSTSHQELETQRKAVEEWAQFERVIIDEVLEEVASGKEDERHNFNVLWDWVRKKKVKTIVVVELSRLARNMRTLVNFLYDCVENDVMVVSLNEGWLVQGLTNPIVRPVLVGMLGALYELERKMIGERTRAGLARAKAQGKHVGRKPMELDKDVVIALLNDGKTKTEIAKKFGISRQTLYEKLREWGLAKSKKR